MKSQLIYLLSFLFFITGCNKNMEENVFGTKLSSTEEGSKDENSKDVIGLSTKTIQFTGRKDTVQIQTEGLGWWFKAITVDGIKYEITPENNETQLENQKFAQTCDWLTINREANNITLIAASNIKSEQRTFELSLQAGDYFDSIKGMQEIRPVGDWDDGIGLSQKEVEFSWRGGTVTINTKESWWWFNSIEVDGSKIIIGDEGSAQMEEGKEFLKKCNWLTVHASYKKIELTVEPNHGEARAFRISLQAGDYFDTIEGNQEEAMVGDWDDCLGLSMKKVEFTAEGGGITIDTQGSGWWLNTIEVDGEKTNIESNAQTEEKDFLKKCDWLTVHTSYKKIELTVEPNVTGKNRSFKVYLQAGNYFDYIEGIQVK